MKFMWLLLVLFPVTGYSLEFSCRVNALIGFGEGNDLVISSRAGETLAAAEDFPVACGLIQSEQIIFCLKGKLAQSTNFKDLKEADLIQVRTDVHNEWVQAGENDASFFAKFLDGTGNSATGLMVTCRKTP